MNYELLMLLVLILLGLSGSGKGTQAELLARKFGFEYIAMGELLRREIKKKTKLGKKIYKIINIKGQLVLDKITTKIFANHFIKKLKNQKKIILDGYPRTLEQVKELEKIFKKQKIKNFFALYIKISEAEAVKRLSGRLVCQKCQTIHFPGDIACRKCGNKLIKREDDTPKKIKTRLAWGKKKLAPVIRYYQKLGRFLEINGETEVGMVHKEIVKKLKRYLQNVF
ncbi:MAG: nucleoside monophosphate kinase [Patescibacteria group bacterium]